MCIAVGDYGPGPFPGKRKSLHFGKRNLLKRDILIIGALLLSYPAGYLFMRSTAQYITVRSIAGGVDTQYIRYNWLESEDWADRWEYLQWIDDPIMLEEAEWDGGASFFKPMIFLEERIRGIGEGRPINGR